MKIQKFLLATMLCGVFGVFTACSDDLDTVTNEPEVTMPEELETVLSFSAGVSDGLLTRSADDDAPDRDPEEVIGSMAVAIFKVNDGKLGQILAFSANSNVKKDADGSGYSLPPLKFKTSADNESTESKIAIVVLANYGKLFSNSESVPVSINTFNQFKAYTDLKMETNMGNAYQAIDGTIFQKLPDGNDGEEAQGFYLPYLYPMSSNVNIYSITPGKINSIGVDKEIAINSVNAIEDGKEFTENDVKIINDYPIPLYRGAAEIVLQNLTFDDYGDMEFERFVLERIFIINAPVHVNWIGSKIGTSNWGDSLTVNFDSYTGKFYSGDNTNDFETATGTGEYRIASVAESTVSAGMFDFTHSNRHYRNGVSKSEFSSGGSDFYGQFTKKGIYPMHVDYSNPSDFDMSSQMPYIKFVSAPNNYGLGKSICLVVKGRYFAKAPGTNITIGGESKYYTVVVNQSGAESQTSSVKANTGEVCRNVRYNINLTISGPGSDTPWDYTKNSYVVPKVRIVPFGLVEQDSKLD